MYNMKKLLEVWEEGGVEHACIQCAQLSFRHHVLRTDGAILRRKMRLSAVPAVNISTDIREYLWE